MWTYPFNCRFCFGNVLLNYYIWSTLWSFWITSSAMEPRFYARAPVLFVLAHKDADAHRWRDVLIVSSYSTDLPKTDSKQTWMQSRLQINKQTNKQRGFASVFWRRCSICIGKTSLRIHTVLVNVNRNFYLFSGKLQRTPFKANGHSVSKQWAYGLLSLHCVN